MISQISLIFFLFWVHELPILPSYWGSISRALLSALARSLLNVTGLGPAAGAPPAPRPPAVGAAAAGAPPRPERRVLPAPWCSSRRHGAGGAAAAAQGPAPLVRRPHAPRAAHGRPAPALRRGRRAFSGRFGGGRAACRGRLRAAPSSVQGSPPIRRVTSQQGRP